LPIPLERPQAPTVDERLRWPGRVVAVFGPGDRAFAEALVAGRDDAALVRAELRHGPGFEVVDGCVHAHPDALLEGLDAARPDAALVVGTGAAFAVAVEPSLTVWIADGAHPFALPRALRAAARGASLVLESARPGVAEALAVTL